LAYPQRLVQHCPPNPQPLRGLGPGQVSALQAGEDPIPEPVVGDWLRARRPTDVLTLRLGPLHARLHPLGERLLLELRPGDGDVEHGLAERCRGVDPRLLQGAQAAAPAPELLEGLGAIQYRSECAIEAPD